jgi:hypothetical protein
MGSDQLHAYEMAASQVGTYQAGLSDEHAAIQTSYADADMVKNVPELDDSKKYLQNLAAEGNSAERALNTNTVAV